MAPELLHWLCALFPVFGEQKLSFIRRLFALFLVFGEQKLSFIQRLFALCPVFGELCFIRRLFALFPVFGEQKLGRLLCVWYLELLVIIVLCSVCIKCSCLAHELKLPSILINCQGT